MGALMAARGLRVTDAELDLFWRFHQLLRAHNARLDLTRLHGFETIVVRHYVDCGLVARMMELPSPLLDIGTGPGFPGIPLAILSPETRFILADTRSKRTGFLEDVARELSLQNVEVYGHKILPDWGRRVGGIITRAVEAIPATLERAAGLVETGGLAIFMKGPECDAEIEEAERTQGARWRLARDDAYTIAGTTLARRLVVYERLHDARADVEIREITSAANETYKTLRASLTARGIKRSGLGIVGGRRIAAEIARDHPGAVAAWIVLEERGRTRDGGVEPPAGARVYRMPKALFAELDFPGAGPPLVAVKVPELRDWDPAAAPEGCTLVLALQDPENVGAAIRSAAAFGVREVVLLEEAAHPFHPKALRAAGVAALGVRLWKGPSIERLATGALPLFALSGEGGPLRDARWPERFALLAGVEGPGLPEALRRGPRALAIPIQATVESLNAAVAISIALYEWRRGTPAD
ncbi:MAG: 16S rRNA (guanine(527)-N(7))-methyltransferase RsmG [Myxococcales bacterium]|nr:16S rRNA (guanine(527)-N(7))-methyltransferase RsmG [Myxococcales bacterium]